MSLLVKAPKGLLFASIIWNDDYFEISKFKEAWLSEFGELEEFIPSFNPSFEYYEKEMQSPLKRIIVFSKSHVEREKLIVAKLWATKFEQSFSHDNKRTINIDPGLLTLENMVLSTGKPYSHRIYLGDGVYADLNYIYRNGSYQGLEWTYPDYNHEEKIQHFNKIRKFLLKK